MALLACQSEAEDCFYDTRDEITSVSELGLDSFDDCCSSHAFFDDDYEHLVRAIWFRSPESSYLRRLRLLRWMGLPSDQNKFEETNIEIHRTTDESGAAVTCDSYLEGPVSSIRFSVRSIEDSEFQINNNFLCRIKNLNDGTEFIIDDSPNEMSSGLNQVGLDKLITLEELHRNFGSSPFVQQFFRREAGGAHCSFDLKRKQRKSWLHRLIGRSCMSFSVRESKAVSVGLSSSEAGALMGRVRVHSMNKKFKELSALYGGQEFPAHEGSILTMKFNHDGQFLATAGEDGVVRIWKVIVDERPSNFSDQLTDPSCLYLSINHLSKLVPLDVNKEKLNKMRRMKKSLDSSCVILPQKIFRLIEEPLHEFHGHTGEVLSLSWSNKGYLLSSSSDQTARLWKIGENQCLRLFHHNNYVTSVEFCPNDDNYFISGCIDGKVRIWEVHGGQVINWIDMKDIVTAVSYYPNGKGAVVGLMDGSCCFYDIVDNHLQLNTQTCLKEKKKLSCKRIIGFQFSPVDQSKVLVTSANSQIRLLSGCNIIFKFKARKTLGSQIKASFTMDGRHIISTSDDSQIYVWDCDQETPSKTKKIYSKETFSSPFSSISTPWSIMNVSSSPSPPFSAENLSKFGLGDRLPSLSTPSPDCFSLSRTLLFDPFKGSSATWPEENLISTINKSKYKFFKNACLNTSVSHMWGVVIVTSGLDGRIRTYCNYGLPLRL
ncbi:WD repeat-containing protein 44-like [Impatiens glandulifera]|uniref:WD repeat-containing protein 44-like n=1 Tax=Impatiens glandulifera TaxID=253017 RepID=UPI001FB183A1|nr:WD repeat-containing protein 44-like [Impatiens glandulifera]